MSEQIPSRDCEGAKVKTRRGRSQASSWGTFFPPGEQSTVPADEVDIDEEIRALFGVEPEELKPVSVERMREILAKCSGSLAADIIADREDRL